MRQRKCFWSSAVVFYVFFAVVSPALGIPQGKTECEDLLQIMHSISSHSLYCYVAEMASDKYEGRLTGTDEFKASAEWLATHFKKWGIAPLGDNGTYFQAFPNPYTLIFKDCQVILHVPQNSGEIKKYYTYEDEFIPGATSASGEITAEVVYVGYGITAPELGYDEYADVDVRGKIVLMEREAPFWPDDGAEIFKKWRSYSFHQYKLKNAVAHGAKGMLYNYGPISNPNNAYSEGFIYSHVGEAVVADVFTGTGRVHKSVIEKIKMTVKPQSFATGKVFTIINKTEHISDGTGYNVIGLLEGSDPELKDEVIILGAHLDHLGRCYEIMPGANDNASGVAIIMSVAKALASAPVELRRSVMFLCFGAEEQGIAGSKYYLEHPVIPLEKTVGLINLDGVGAGDKINALAAKNYPDFWDFIEKANEKYVHRIVEPRQFDNLARPRLDAARFMWAGVPSLSFNTYGTESFYHTTKDNMNTITPEIMEDLAQILFMAVVDMCGRDALDFRN